MIYVVIGLAKLLVGGLELSGSGAAGSELLLDSEVLLDSSVLGDSLKSDGILSGLPAYNYLKVWLAT